MNILSYNTAYGEYEPELRDFLASKIGEVAVFCFQESAGDTMKNVVAELFDDTDFTMVTAEKRTPESRYGFHTIVKKPLRIASNQTLLETDDPAVGQALATEIELENGSAFTVVNVHGIPFPGHKLDTDDRLKQTDQIVAWQSKNSTPAVICGDFNLLPETESVKRFSAAGYQDLIAKYAIETTRNRRIWDLYPDNVQLFADYAFTSPELAVTEFRVPYTEASDHLPMIISLQTP